MGGLWGASNTLVHIGGEPECVSEGWWTWVGLGTLEWGPGGIAAGKETAWLVAGMWVGAHPSVRYGCGCCPGRHRRALCALRGGGWW